MYIHRNISMKKRSGYGYFLWIFSQVEPHLFWSAPHTLRAWRNCLNKPLLRERRRTTSHLQSAAFYLLKSRFSFSDSESSGSSTFFVTIPVFLSFSCEISLKNHKTSPRKRLLFTHKELSRPFRPSSDGRSGTLFLPCSFTAHKSILFAAKNGLLHMEAVNRLSCFAIAHILFFSMVRLARFLAPSFLFHTRSQSLSLLFKICCKRRLQAFRVHLFIGQLVQKFSSWVTLYLYSRKKIDLTETVNRYEVSLSNIWETLEQRTMTQRDNFVHLGALGKKLQMSKLEISFWKSWTSKSCRKTFTLFKKL